ncbi:MAG: hypothetical protein VXW85_01995 [Candidatus Thermoplasmatota archaeon]|nr:hypothetical protein [Candidatus Thermoplasmatota archaeon]MEC8311649.1 hypothetical protein [Candidatus Thermoplasmatota archaeon]
MAWTPAWSSKITAPVASLVAGPGWCLFGHERRMTLMADDGGHRWTHDLLFTPHRVVVAGPHVGVLAAHGFTVHHFDDGTPVNEGRAVSRGFSSLIARPGGGWLASGREGDLHLFTKEGRGRSRVTRAPVRGLVGWLDRDQAVVHDHDGMLRLVHVGSGEDLAVYGEEAWTWVSSLDRDGMLLRGADGMLHRGVPGAAGWDRIERMDSDVLEPIAAVRSAEGWVLLELDGRILSTSEGQFVHEGAALGDPVLLLGGDGSETLTGVTREGLIRCWYGGERERIEREARRALVADGQRAADWAQRRRRFEAAVEAEERADWATAALHYEALGREEDVQRVRRRGGEDDD